MLNQCGNLLLEHNEKIKNTYVIVRAMKICIPVLNELEGQHNGNYQGVRNLQVRCLSLT